MTSFDLTGRVAVVTGASRGLGRHFAGVLAAAGASVALWARDGARLEAACAELRALGQVAVPVVADVTDAAQVEAAVAASVAALGPISILVNNAGIATDAGVLAVTDADWSRVMATNLDGPFRVARAIATQMVGQGGGSIVNVASVLGIEPLSGVAPYAASKAALLHLTRALALELARHGIRVNALAPGYVETDLNRDLFASEAGQRLIKTRVPQRRLIQASELDGALLLLASDAGSAITGSTLVVDGGFLLT